MYQATVVPKLGACGVTILGQEVYIYDTMIVDLEMEFQPNILEDGGAWADNVDT